MQRFRLLKSTSGDIWVDLTRVIAVQPAQPDRSLVWIDGMRTTEDNAYFNLLIPAEELIDLCQSAHMDDVYVAVDDLEDK